MQALFTDGFSVTFILRARMSRVAGCLLSPGAHFFIISFTNEGKEGMKTNAYNYYAFSVKKKNSAL